MNNNNFGYLSISEIHDLYKSKEVSPVEVINETLDNIEKINEELQAYVTITTQYAKSKAQEAEKKFLNNEKMENGNRQQLVNFARNCLLLISDSETSYFSAYFGPVKS